MPDSSQNCSCHPKIVEQIETIRKSGMWLVWLIGTVMMIVSGAIFYQLNNVASAAAGLDKQVAVFDSNQKGVMKRQEALVTAQGAVITAQAVMMKSITDLESRMKESERNDRRDGRTYTRPEGG